MNYNMELFWQRAANLWKAHQSAEDQISKEYGWINYKPSCRESKGLTKEN